MKNIDPAWLAFEEAHPIVVPGELENPHASTREAADQLRNGRHLGPDGSVHCCGAATFRIGVFRRSVERALRLVDALSKACEVRGFKLRPIPGDRQDAGLCIWVGEEPIEVELVEIAPHILCLRTDPHKRNGSRSVRRDRLNCPLESQLNKIMLHFRSLAWARVTGRQSAAAFEKRVQAFDRGRAELHAQVTREQTAVDRLVSDATAWRQAAMVRDYLAAMKVRSVPTKESRTKAWLEWAFAQADRLDPLCPSPPSILDTSEEAYRAYGWWEELPDELYDDGPTP